MLAQNDSVPIRFEERVLPLSERSIAGYVALTGETVTLPDVYELPAGVPYAFDDASDRAFGYRTRAMLTVPLRTPRGEIVGVLQLLNPKTDASARLDSPARTEAVVRPFTPLQVELAASLASQAAVALTNSQLYEAIQRLFEGFVRAAVVAIEARDPNTSGHSFRVANLTVALAEALDRHDTGTWRDVRFTREHMRAIRYAALLHDFGKVGVREDVLVKAKKLYPAQLRLLEHRFRLARKTRELALLRERLEYALTHGREAYLERAASFDAALTDTLERLDRYWDIVQQANEPTVMPEGGFDQLLEIAATIDQDESTALPLLTEDEVQLLSLRKGSLSEAERQQIESHVLHTYRFLSQIPWTREIRLIPAIAVAHHEKLNGTGYPFRLSAPDIPVETRMMTIADIFDALSASDRPYKKAVPIDRALDILGFAVKDGELDAELVSLFIEARVYDRWKTEPFPY